MEIAAIIAEYNPFHNGHRYQMDFIRKNTDADHIIIIMSGNFVQRGAPALADKYARAEAALLGGADAVFELPVRYSTACARDFAYGAVSMLNAFGCVDYLCFGCEDPWLFTVDRLMDGSLFTSAEFDEVLKSGLKKGESFATARADAILSTIKKQLEAPCLSEKLTVLDSALKSPNNILALEYVLSLAKLKSGIKAMPIERVGDSYGSMTVNSGFPSATALRGLLFSPHPEIVFDREYMPTECADVLKNYISSSCLMHSESFSKLLSYSILIHADELEHYLDSSTELANRLKNFFRPGFFWDETASALKTKNYTLTRINRFLTHILLGIPKESAIFPDTDYPKISAAGSAGSFGAPPSPYAHLLGMRRESSKLIAHIKEHSLIPVFSSPRELEQRTDGYARMMLEADLRATDIYHIAQEKKAMYKTDYEVSGIFI